MQNTGVHFGLQGRVVVITGGAQGIGEACARRLVRDGGGTQDIGASTAGGSRRIIDELMAPALQVR